MVSNWKTEERGTLRTVITRGYHARSVMLQVQLQAQTEVPLIPTKSVHGKKRSEIKLIRWEESIWTSSMDKDQGQ